MKKKQHMGNQDTHGPDKTPEGTIDTHHQILSELDSAAPSAGLYAAETPFNQEQTMHDDIIDSETIAEMAEENAALEQALDGDLPALVTALRAELHDAQAKASQYFEQLQRKQAEIENIKHRASLDIAKAHKFALEKFVADLLPVTDSLERGLSEALASNASLESLQQGTELTLNMLIKVLNKHHVTQLDPIGEIFNPELHEAVSIVAVPGAKPSSIHQVLQKGYLLSERLVRPATVIVTKT